MPMGGWGMSRFVEYFILHGTRPTGPSIGFYGDREIPASVVDLFDRHYMYAGVAPRRWNGQFDIDALEPGEFIVLPGIVYRLDEVKSSYGEPIKSETAGSGVLWRGSENCQSGPDVAT